MSVHIRSDSKSDYMLRFIAIYLLQVIRENSKSEIQSFKKGKISEHAQCLVFPIVYLISRGNCTFLINFDLLESCTAYIAKLHGLCFHFRNYAYILVYL